jgi:hypothetical protein
MTKTLAVAAMVAAASMAEAASDDARRAAREQAPRLMKDAVAAGTIDAADFAAVADWILHEKEEKVAAGLIDVLGAVEPAIAPAGGQRWDATTRAVFSLFATVLRDAQGDHRRSGRDLDPEIADLVSAAAPAVAATLQEVDPESKARIAALLHAFGPLAGDLAPLMGADVLGAAREALGKTPAR